MRFSQTQVGTGGLASDTGRNQGVVGQAEGSVCSSPDRVGVGNWGPGHPPTVPSPMASLQESHGRVGRSLTPVVWLHWGQKKEKAIFTAQGPSLGIFFLRRQCGRGALTLLPAPQIQVILGTGLRPSNQHPTNTHCGSYLEGPQRRGTCPPLLLTWCGSPANGLMRSLPSKGL